MTLPKNTRIKVLAVTKAVNGNDSAKTARPTDDGLFLWPRITPAGGAFVDKTRVAIEAGADSGDIHFTLDGSEPTRLSRRYDGPFDVARDTTLKARAFPEGVDIPVVSTAKFAKLALLPAEKADGVSSGVNFRYFEGEWKRLPGFDSLTPVKQGKSDRFSLDQRQRREQFGLSFSGFVSVPRDGAYTFFTRSDDGSRLRIGSSAVADNDGVHGTVERSVAVGLKAGLHPITVEYFQGKGDLDFDILYEGPGIPKQPIPAAALFRRANAGQ